MTAAAIRTAPRTAGLQTLHEAIQSTSVEPEVVAAKLDWPYLDSHGTWLPELSVFRPSVEHPVYVPYVCGVGSDPCPRLKERHGANLCEPHRRVWKSAGEPDLGTWDAPVVSLRSGERLVYRTQEACRVCCTPGHRRPARQIGLCQTHNARYRSWVTTRRKRRQAESVADWIADMQPEPLPGLDECGICGEPGQARFYDELWCNTHANQITRLSPKVGYEAARARVLRRARIQADDYDFGGLPDRLRNELLLVLQCLFQEGYANPGEHIRLAIETLRKLAVESFSDINTVDGLAAQGRGGRPLSDLSASRLRTMQKLLYRAVSSAQAEMRKTIWDLTLLGRDGYLDFRRITQPWLREAGLEQGRNLYAANAAGSTFKSRINALSYLSRSLRTRPDEGNHTTALGRDDIRDFLASMHRRVNAELLTEQVAYDFIAIVRMVIQDWIDQDETDPGGCVDGLKHSFRIRPQDMPRKPEPDRTEVGKALPREVTDVLLLEDNLQKIGGKGTEEYRLAVEMLLGTGRRPIEVCAVKLDCLDDSGATPHFVHDMTKVHKVGFRLPIAESLAEKIRQQQARARAQFPNTPEEDLVLLPRSHNNPHGTKPVAAGNLARKVRMWVRDLDPIEISSDPEPGYATEDLPEVKVRDAEEAADAQINDATEEGPDLIEDEDIFDAPDRPDAALTSIEFDRKERAENPGKRLFPKSKVYLYAFRHTWAQAHADGGTSHAELQELMGHERAETTSVYYRLPMARRIKSMQRVQHLTAAGADRRRAERARAATEEQVRAVLLGRVIPHGYCGEPANKKAGGRACPVQHNCATCRFFTTDASNLPELYAFRSRLVEARENALTDPSPFADAADRDLHVAVLKRQIEKYTEVIDECLDSLNELDDETRASLLATIEQIRQGRDEVDALVPEFLRGLIRGDLNDITEFVDRETAIREAQRTVSGVLR